MRFSYYFTVRRSENVWFVHTSTSRIRKTCLPVFTEPCSAAAVSFVRAQSGTLVAIAVELRLLFWVVSVATLAPHSAPSLSGTRWPPICRTAPCTWSRLDQWRSVKISPIKSLLKVVESTIRLILFSLLKCCVYTYNLCANVQTAWQKSKVLNYCFILFLH